MKKHILTTSLILLALTSFGQVKVQFSSFDAWRQNTSTKKMEFIKKFSEPGYIELNKEKSTLILYNKRKNQKELFQFMPIRKVDGGHYLGFGKVDTQQMITIIPQDKLLLLKVNDIVVMKFDLSNINVANIIRELTAD
jgi:hypothetical protein